MPGARGQSKGEVLDGLITELQRLGSGARKSGLKNWRARADEAMSDLFGPRHRLTLDLRAVTFTDFAQGRARALALLRSASTLAAASSRSKDALAQPAATAEPELPDATADPSRAEQTTETVEEEREAAPRKAEHKSGSSGTHPDVPDETLAAVPSEAPERLPAEPPDGPLAKAPEPTAPPEPVAPPEPTAPPMPADLLDSAARARPRAPAKLDSIAEAAFNAWPDETAELLEIGATTDKTGAVTEDASHQRRPDTTAVADGPDATVAPAAPAGPRAPAELDSIAEAAFIAWPDATAELLEPGAPAMPSGATEHDAPAQAEPTPSEPTEDAAEPAPGTVVEPTLDAPEPKRETGLRRTVRKRNVSEKQPTVPDELTDIVGGEVPGRLLAVEPAEIPSEPATAQPAPPSGGPVTIAEPLKTGVSSPSSGMTDHDITAQPKGMTAFRKIIRKRDSAERYPAISDEVVDTSPEEPPEPPEKPSAEAASTVLNKLATARPEPVSAGPDDETVSRKIRRIRGSWAQRRAIADAPTGAPTDTVSGVPELAEPATMAESAVPIWPDWSDAIEEPQESVAATGATPLVKEDVSSQPKGETVLQRIVRTRGMLWKRPVVSGEPTDVVGEVAPEGPETATEPTPETVEPGRESVFRKVVRMRETLWRRRVALDETVDATLVPAGVVDEDASVQTEREKVFRRILRMPGTWGKRPAVPDESTDESIGAVSGVPEHAQSVTVVESAVPDWPDWSDTTEEPPETGVAAEPSETSAAAEASPLVEDDVSAQPKHETVLHRIVRTRGMLWKRPAVPEQTGDAVLEEAPAASAVAEPEVAVGGLFTPQLKSALVEPSRDWVFRKVARIRETLRRRPAVPDETVDAAPGPVEPDAVAEDASVQPERDTIFHRIVQKCETWRKRPGIAEEETVGALPGETLVAPAAVEAETAVADLFTAQREPVPAEPAAAGPTEAAVEPAEAAVEPAREKVFRRIVRKRETSGAAPAIPREPPGVYEEASLRPRPGSEWLKIGAAVIVFLALAVGVPVWLVWFGGLSVFSGQDPTPTTTVARPLTTLSPISPSANSRVVDADDDPRRVYIIDVVRAGIVQLQPNEANEVSFLPAKPVRRGEFLVWLDRVRAIPTGSGEVPDTLYYDLDTPLREKAIDAYRNRVVLAWPDEDTKIAFSAADPILVRDAEAWAARMIVRLLPASALQDVLDITETEALDLRARISALKPLELAKIVEGFELLPEAGWAQKESISRSEAAEFLMRLKAVFD